jgi:hypothetical protein
LFLVFEDLIAFDGAFVKENKLARQILNEFFYEKYDFKVKGYEFSKMQAWLEPKRVAHMFNKFLSLLENDTFKNIFSYLNMKDISMLDQAFVNKIGRNKWNSFLEERCEFKLSGFDRIDKLHKILKWLKLKKTKITSFHMKAHELTRDGCSDWFRYESVFADILLSNNLRAITIEMGTIVNHNFYLFHILHFSCYKCTNLRHLRLIFPKSREWSFNRYLRLILSAEKFIHLEEIHLINYINGRETIKSFKEIFVSLSKLNSLKEIYFWHDDDCIDLTNES